MRKIKRIIAALCMAATLLALPACSQTQDESASTLDLSTSTQISMVSEALVSQIVSIPEEELDGMIASQEQSRNYVLSEALTSWKNMIPDTGAFVEVQSATAELQDNEYVCDLVAQFEERLVDCQVYFDAESGEPTAISFAPRYTTGERMQRAGLNTLIGMGTVFIVLIFISLLIYCFKYINVLDAKMKKKEAPAESAPVSGPEELVEAEPEENLADDLELVAVITAAIAASEDVPADGLVVRSIKRAPKSRWK
ncbi:MAG TPA: OadG family protein [Candidatus Lachnoclostridium stercorigallinarum]|uniref:OadG family protein n=1 Tax=Candidatus Lachnoclostridium stercorigallinarum TaxID=2838634 RepID=A0A9D2GID5_9FIRM|nr:OadG family protein [Candidatus Lachnoclostridium stercorigallinarum]